MATEKQKAAFKLIMENHGNVSKTMRDVGYDDTTAKNPKNLTESKGWLELVEEHLPDTLLTKVHKEGLKAVKKQFKNNNTTGQIEEVGEEPDYAVRHKYLDTAYKIKGKVVDKFDIDVDVNRIIRLDE